MILESGSKVLVVHRRLFEKDQPRYFVGTVEAYENGVARVTGNTWARDGAQGVYVAKKHPSTKVVSIASGTVMVYQLPTTTDFSSLSLVVNREGDLLLGDRHGVKADLSENLHARPGKAKG